MKINKTFITGMLAMVLVFGMAAVGQWSEKITTYRRVIKWQ
jgi:hypothetical protein